MDSTSSKQDLEEDFELADDLYKLNDIEINNKKSELLVIGAKIKEQAAEGITKQFKKSRGHKLSRKKATWFKDLDGKVIIEPLKKDMQELIKERKNIYASKIAMQATIGVEATTKKIFYKKVPNLKSAKGAKISRRSKTRVASCIESTEITKKAINKKLIEKRHIEIIEQKTSQKIAELIKMENMSISLIEAKEVHNIIFGKNQKEVLEARLELAKSLITKIKKNILEDYFYKIKHMITILKTALNIIGN
ncbi:34649_t:CDS:2 [Gigaspora margarita]|uniref:34649_t:CDS:1 n=1 Tax=Gigaspora margarita TaxID=4874 RepID=A0ABM8VWB4_GIGMA|nr:34649_t:CDS:2 [Gigaspora margarita]